MGIQIRYDVFVSYARVDRDAVIAVADALQRHGLRVFIDQAEIDDFARITATITRGLANSKALLAYYSATYPTRRACQWELSAAYLAAQRQDDPARRILVINPESTDEHLQPNELRDALFRRPPRKGDETGLAELAESVARHVDGLSGSLNEVVPLVPPRWLPTQGLGSTRFVGRLANMWRLHSALHPDTTGITEGRTGPGVAQVRGLGGIGKSLLVEEYALRFGAAYPGGVFWLRAYGSYNQADLPPDDLEARRHDEVRRIAELLGIAVHGQTPEQITGAVGRAIETKGKPCLWVVDDLPKGLSAWEVRRWFAPHSLARTLITTRSHAYEALAAVVDLDVLGDNEAYELLTARRPPTGETEQRAAKAIVTALGGHALAVDVTGAALRNQQQLASYADFLADLAASETDHLEGLVAELSEVLPVDHEASIAHTLLRSTDQLGEEGWDFLRLASSIAPAPIPAELVEAAFQQVDDLDDKQAARRAGRALDQAASLSLAVQADVQNGGAWLVHAVVTRTARFQDSLPARLAALRMATVKLLIDALPATVDAEVATLAQDLVPHIRELVRRATTRDEIELLTWLAVHDHARAQFRSAEALRRQLWEARRRGLGPDHPDTLAAKSGLAVTLHALGDFLSARDLHEEVLEAHQRLTGPNHRSTLVAKNNLAITLHSRGDLIGARSLQEQVVGDISRVLGPGDRDTLAARNSLAATLYDLGDRRGARNLLESTLKAAEGSLGPEHADTLNLKNSLAVVLRGLGDLRAARTVLEQVLDALQRVLGPDHPNTSSARNNLAGTLVDLGDLASARSLHAQAAANTEQVLGPDHPDTLSAKGNLAKALFDLGDRAGARTLLEQVHRSAEQLLGPDHPDVLTGKQNLAVVLRALGEFDAARRLHEEVLDSRLRVLGPDHPAVFSTRDSLSLVLHSLGEFDAARRLHEQVLHSRLRVLGPDHPDTLSSRSNLALTLHKLGDLAGARRLQEQVLDSQARVLGPDHPDTLSSRSNLGVTLCDLGEFDAARRLHEQVLHSRLRVLGSDHPDTQLSRNNLAQALRDLSDLGGARTLFAEVLDGYQRVLGHDHPDTLSARSNVAVVRHAQGDLVGARRQLEQVLDTRARLLGREHPDTLNSMANLAITLYELGELVGARQLMEQAALGFRRLLGPDHPTTQAVTDSLGTIARARFPLRQPLRRRRPRRGL